MTIQKTWNTIKFLEKEAYIEAALNYETGKYSLTHGNNDENVTFTDKDNSIQVSIQRARCVLAALKYIKQELEL